MQRYSWKRNKLIILGITLIGLYLCFRCPMQIITTSAVLSDTKPVDVWEFVADFSNMIKLNPTISDFNILSDEGTFDHWKYTVQYTELLSHWPYLENVALAHYSVKPEGLDYIIESEHKTCFFIGLYCLKSSGHFRFSKASSGTRCTEKVSFECPFIMSSFCKRESVFQRQIIMDNLRIQFNGKK